MMPSSKTFISGRASTLSSRVLKAGRASRSVHFNRQRHICKQAAADVPNIPPTPVNQPPTPVTPPPAEAEKQLAESPPKRNLWQKIKHFFVGEKLDKERLAALGMGAFASYGVISNVTYGACFTIAWLSFVKATGLSPMAPGQWPGFLAFYAGLWTFQNFVRPLRFSLALALAPLFNTYIDNIAAKTGLGKKWAFGILLAGIAIGTTATLFSTIYLLGGFPPTPPAN